MGLLVIVPKQQVELGVQRVAQEKLDDDSLGLELFDQAMQRCFISVGGEPVGQLLAQLLCELYSSAGVRWRCPCSPGRRAMPRRP